MISDNVFYDSFIKLEGNVRIVLQKEANNLLNISDRFIGMVSMASCVNKKEILLEEDGGLSSCIKDTKTFIIPDNVWSYFDNSISKSLISIGKTIKNPYMYLYGFFFNTVHDNDISEKIELWPSRYAMLLRLRETSILLLIYYKDERFHKIIEDDGYLIKYGKDLIREELRKRCI